MSTSAPVPIPPAEPEARRAALLAQLAARAFTIIPGGAYNQHRVEATAGERPPLYFEAALPSDAPQRALAEQVLPTLARYLEAKSRSVEAPRGVVVALFFQEQCYLLHGEALVALFCEQEGLSRAELHARAVAWRALESR